MKATSTVCFGPALSVAAVLLPFIAAGETTVTPPDNPQGCMKCHEGIAPIRNTDSEMWRQILAEGTRTGDPDGCVLCHGGDRTAVEEDPAHAGPAFYPDPGSPWVNARICGKCHPSHVKTQWNSLMMTEAGKIQGTAWSFGSLSGYDHRWANYDVASPADPNERVGTATYAEYMARLKTLEPGVYPDAMTTVPDAPTDPKDLVKNPELSVFTYIRTECQRCHLAVKGRFKRGDYRGMGCSACHIPYGNEGLYEGGDPSIPKMEPGHMLVHTIQATREAKVTVHGTTYSGIPIETCTTCHDRGKRVGVSFQGLMESAYASPYTRNGGQLDLHTKHYLAMHPDVHSSKGMMCLDCHSTIDVHGDGFLAGTNLGQIETECADCHGTTRAYPWELPLGFGDEFDEPPQTGAPRGVTTKLLPHTEQGTVYPPEDGYLLTSRGNPIPNAVRKGHLVIVHAAGGEDIELKPVRRIAEERAMSVRGRVAMHQATHTDKLECYTCHSAWAPQCYGCHLRIDYSKGKKRFDWVKAGHLHETAERLADNSESEYDAYVPGEVEESRSYMRWEEPALGVNGEGRITPVAPGCQPVVTLIDENGEALILNHIFRTTPGTEGAGPEGQLGIDMSPLQPHTTTKAVRECTSCHLSAKALGHGIQGGVLNRPWNEGAVVDLMTADGTVLSKNARVQIEPITGLASDWSRFVTEDGRQMQTVGHHFARSRPLSDTERGRLDRENLCVACHKEIPTESPAAGFLHHAATYTGQLPDTAEKHHNLVNKILLIAGWVQLGGAIGAPIVGLVIAAWWLRRRRRRHGA